MTEFRNTKHGEVLYEAVIKLDPKTKKNSMEIKYRRGNYGQMIPFIGQSDRYIQYEKDCKWFLRPPRNGTIKEKVNVQMVFYRESKRRVDLCNLENAILDILVKYGIIEDDNRNIVFSMDGSKVLFDKENPRTEITIERIEQ